MASGKTIRKLKRISIIVGMLIVVFLGYVEIVNLNSHNMTYRQKILKAVYPAFMWFTKLLGKNTTDTGKQDVVPPVSFYSLKTLLNNGTELDFASLAGKKILLVNTASDCGYTDQYSELQQLQEQNSAQLVVIGFPANDFKEQEKGSDEEIASFCKLNYGVTFPLAKKSMVVNGAGQNAVFKWLTDPAQNGWNNKLPSWNFTKFLVNEKGVLTHYFAPSVSPVSKEVIAAINTKN